MKNYTLTESKDDNGQPNRFFKAAHENNTSKAIDQLSGICSGILADGIVNESEAKFFADWVKKFSPYEPVWPFTDILSRIDRIFADGVCDEDERQELKEVMERLCGYGPDFDPSETYSTNLPLDDPQPESIDFSGKQTHVTGRFAHGTRTKVFETINSRGGICVDTAPTKKTHLFIIGAFASRDWISTNYGRKIERAVELRESGSGIIILSENHWKKFI